MRPYDVVGLRKEPCPKCLSNSEPYAALYRWDVRFREAPFIWGSMTRGEPDHLEITCAEFGYSFSMATADEAVSA